jgi:hypothetical protein
VATYLLLWSLPIGLLILLALVPWFATSVRVASLGTAVVLTWFAWAVHGVKWMANRLTEHLSGGVQQPSSTSAASALELLQKLGVTGDLFGGINALFAALAFGGVAIAAYLQFGTNRQSKIQSFEGAFYSAVDLLHRIAEGLSFDDAVLDDDKFDEQIARLRLLAGLNHAENQLPPFTGRGVFPAVVSGIAKRTKTPEAVSGKYRVLQNEHNYVLGHYFRHLYQVLKLIDRQPEEVISTSDKESYASVLRAQLSTSELALLLLNCTGDMVDQGQFRNLLVRYHMLEHLPYWIDGQVVRARQSGLLLGDLWTMQQFKDETPLDSSSRVQRGAFGANPVVIPPAGSMGN